MKKEYKLYLIIAGLIALLCFTAFKWYQKSGEVSQWRHNYDVLQTEHQTYVLEADGKIVSYQQALLLTEEQLRQAIASDSIHSAMARKYKKLSERITIKTEFVYDTIFVSEISGISDTSASDTLIPYINDCMEFDLSVIDGSISLSGISIPNQQDIVLGLRKNGLRKAYWAIDVHNSNPCINVTSLQSTHVIHKKRWWENPLITGTIGVAVGVIGWEMIR